MFYEIQRCKYAKNDSIYIKRYCYQIIFKLYMSNGEDIKFDLNEENQQRLLQQSSIIGLPISSPYFTVRNNEDQILSLQSFLESKQIQEQMLIENEQFLNTISFNHSNESQKLLARKMSISPNTLDPHDIISDVIINYQDNVRTNVADIQKIANFTKLNAKQTYSHIFRKSYFNRQQKSNKNYIKFLLPKFFEKIFIMKEESKVWKEFNKAYYNNKYSRKTLVSLFCGTDINGFKSKNTKILFEMLRDPQFYIKNLYNSNYTKVRKNIKQYLFASKVFSLRCRSRSLLQRVTTK